MKNENNCKEQIVEETTNEIIADEIDIIDPLVAPEFGSWEVSEKEENKREEYEPKRKKIKVKKLSVGSEVIVNSDVKRFCDGRGVPDYARRAYVKRVNQNNNTVLIESEPNGKEYGLLFISDVTVA